MRKLLLVLCTVVSFFHVSYSQSSLQFDASVPRYVEIGNAMNTVLTGTNQITVEGWCYLTAYTFLPTIVGNYGSGMQFLLRVDNTRPAFWIDNGSGSFRSVNGTTVVPLNTCSQLRVYINGVLDGTAVASGGSFPASINPVRIGANLTSEALTGRIDEVRIWTVARTAAQISTARTGCYTWAAPNLLAYYNFEEGSGTTLTDRTGHGYNGSFVNAPVWNTGVVCLATLPVNFTGIHAEYRNNQVSVNWQVSGEQGILHYVVERSVDGVSFSPVGTVNANGAASYAFLDKDPSATAVYYRIRSEELSGISKYSSIVKMAEANTKPAITIAPNPVTGAKLTLQLMNKPVGKYTARVVDLSGRVQFSQVIQQAGLNGVFNLSLPAALAAGMYILQVTDNNQQTESQRFYYRP
jgi:hypothetical protein